MNESDKRQVYAFGRLKWANRIGTGNIRIDCYGERLRSGSTDDCRGEQGSETGG